MDFSGAGELFIDGKPVGRVDGLTFSIQHLTDSLDRFNSALADASEWPDEVIEDVLDAEFIG